MDSEVSGVIYGASKGVILFKWSIRIILLLNIYVGNQKGVVILASWSDDLSMKADGQLESYTPVDADKINAGWIDNNNLFGYSASAVGVIYNTTIVPELNAD